MKRRRTNPPTNVSQISPIAPFNVLNSAPVSLLFCSSPWSPERMTFEGRRTSARKWMGGDEGKRRRNSHQNSTQSSQAASSPSKSTQTRRALTSVQSVDNALPGSIALPPCGVVCALPPAPAPYCD